MSKLQLSSKSVFVSPSFAAMGANQSRTDAHVSQEDFADGVDLALALAMSLEAPPGIPAAPPVAPLGEWKFPGNSNSWPTWRRPQRGAGKQVVWQAGQSKEIQGCEAKTMDSVLCRGKTSLDRSGHLDTYSATREVVDLDQGSPLESLWYLWGSFSCQRRYLCLQVSSRCRSSCNTRRCCFSCSPWGSKGCTNCIQEWAHCWFGPTLGKSSTTGEGICIQPDEANTGRTGALCHGKLWDGSQCQATNSSMGDAPASTTNSKGTTDPGYATQAWHYEQWPDPELHGWCHQSAPRGSFDARTSHGYASCRWHLYPTSPKDACIGCSKATASKGTSRACACARW